MLKEAHCGDTFGGDSLASRVSQMVEVSGEVAMQVTLEEVWEHECGSGELSELVWLGSTLPA